jgi:tetratricopeptide (TPR) repeat protein
MIDDDSKQTPPEVAEFGAMLEPIADAMTEGDFDAALPLMLEAFQWVAEHPLEESAEDRLRTVASEAEARGDWATAERLYLQILDAEGTEPMSARTHWSLASLYRFLGQHDRAIEQGRIAYEISRKDEVEVLHVMAAVALARLSSPNEFSPEVEAALSESLEGLPAGPMFAQSRADALIERANQRRLRADLSSAVALLSEAFTAMEPQRPMHAMPGYQWTISRAWEVQALTHRDLGEMQASGQAWKNALDSRNAARCCFEDESAIDGDKFARFLESAAKGLTVAGEGSLSEELHDECQRVRRKWGLPALDAPL